MSALEKLLDHLVEQGGRLSITWDPADGAVVAYEFGREAEDSPMYGAAAYAGCDTILEALEIVADQVNA
jgi:hypothetical protein